MGVIRHVSAELGSRANNKGMHHIGAVAPKTCNSEPCACLPRRDPGGVRLLYLPRFTPRRHKKVGPKADSLHAVTGFPYLRYLPSTPTLPGPFSTQTRAE
ncbi:hypothetical protein D3C72_1607770 [compost metagenome]